ncbi:hypothetical protein [Spirosoma sp.]|uniref:hypothetical protein n=1 Tax=Spirosoma sp. TaxID=1899569 RepID=UPI003B3B9CC2
MITADQLLPGTYQYTYPTFIDTPQLITIHYLTPDQQKAFVSFPKHPNFKAPQFVLVKWFKSVILQPIQKRKAKIHPQESRWHVAVNKIYTFT